MDSLTITRQEARSLRLFLTVMFVAQAVHEMLSLEHSWDTALWLWLAAGGAYVGLWLCEGVFDVLYDVTQNFRRRPPQQQQQVEQHQHPVLLPVPAAQPVPQQQLSRAAMLEKFVFAHGARIIPQATSNKRLTAYR